MKPSCQGAVETEKLALMKRELTDCHELQNAPAEVIESLHHLWQEVQVIEGDDSNEPTITVFTLSFVQAPDI